MQGTTARAKGGRYHKYNKVVKGKHQALENLGGAALTNCIRVPGAKRASSECQAVSGSPPNC